jgi:hypothetical protein
MTLDERASRAARDLRGRVSEIGAEPLPAGFGQPSRRRIQAVLVVFVLLVAVAVPVALWRSAGDDESAPMVGTGPEGAGVVGPWTAVPAGSAGLGDAQAVMELVSTGDALVAVGGVGPVADQDGAIWRSIDARRWVRVDLPEPSGLIVAVGAEGDRLLAVAQGPSPTGGAMVWSSPDGGRTWTLVADGDDLFGTPAPEMVRPFVDSVRWVDGGFWVAAGGAANGYAGIWISPDGVAWTEVELEGNAAGGVAIASAAGGGYLAHWLSLGWRSTMGEEWVEDPPVLPRLRQLYSVADGAGTALLRATDTGDVAYDTPRELARSADGGRSWTVDERFLVQHPDAVGETVAEVAGLEVVVGWTAGSSLDDEARGRPGAWVSADGGATWSTMPEELREGDLPQQVVMLVAGLGDDVVMMSAGRPLDRVHVLDAAALRSAG